MRSLRLLAVATGALVLGTACGDGGGTPPPDNRAPAAGFSEACTQLSCVFTDASTDPDGDNTITTWLWNFGDNSSANVKNPPAHVYGTAGDKIVVLTVTDDAGATNAFTKTVPVTGTPANQLPTASFSVPSCGAGVDCEFRSTSTDADGNIATTRWEFGDATSSNNTADGVDVTHRYATAGSYNVTLTVTDNGAATGTTTQAVTVLPAAAEDCTTTGQVVLCTLDITQRSTVKLTLTSRDCELSGNRISVVQPLRQTAFGNICSRPFPAEYTITDAAGAPAVFEVGAQLQVQFNQGDADPVDPVPGTPVARVEANAPGRWTVTVDDGGNPDGQNEPDFNDVIVVVEAIAAAP